MQVSEGQIIDTRYDLKYDLKDFNHIIICKSAKSIGFDFRHFNSGYNSGFSSLQYAIIKGFNSIYLLGIDMYSTNETHYHMGYGKNRNQFNQNLKNYCSHFIDILQKLKKERPDIKIISCSPNSKLNKVIDYQPIKYILCQKKSVF